MLSELNIRNIAVIQAADLTFGTGFNAFTGETGAGKSILIGAIGAVLGYRTPKELIRTGETKATVSALFTDIPAHVCTALGELGIECDGEMQVQRTITPDSTVCRVNGQAVTTAQLRRAGALLMNIHGQTDNQMLANSDCHRDFVDAFGTLAAEREAYSALYARYRGLESRLSSLQTDARERERKIDLLRYQTDEIVAANLQSGEEEELHSRRDIIRNAERLGELLESCRAFLSGTDDSEGAVSLLEQAGTALSRAGEFMPDLAALSERVSGFSYELEDAAQEVRSALDALEFDPGELDEIEERIDTVNRLKKKYGGSIDEILAFYDKALSELEALENADVSAEELTHERDAARDEAAKAAAALTEHRAAAGREFAVRVREELLNLDMPHVVFEVARREIPLCESGADELEFMLSVNPGEEPKPLSKIASGGEMSRIMLAIKNVISATDDLGTLIFDEIDTGVSGRAAQKIGAALRRAAAGRQILCVTHLAQVAAYADCHMLIEKQVEDGRTYTRIRTLDRDARIAELARIMSGENITPAALESARELLDFSRK